MKIDAVKWGGVLLIILALMAGSAWAAWAWQANAYGQQLAAKETTHQVTLTNLANANAGADSGQTSTNSTTQVAHANIQQCVQQLHS